MTKKKTPVESGDERPIITDALAVLGRKNFDESLGRDAIHLACLPVIAGEKLYAGNEVGIGTDGRAYDQHNSKEVTLIGIVDPFIGFENRGEYGPDQSVQKGERFLLVLYPRTITSLRHVWSHPGVPSPEEMQDKMHALATRFDNLDPHEKWIRQYADDIEVDFDELVDEAMKQVETGGGNLTGGSNLEGRSVDPEFWQHLKVWKKIRFMPDDMDSEDFFSCAC